MNADVEKVCLDCGVEFVVTGAEQRFYTNRSHDLPKRCKECRRVRKAKNQAAKHQGDSRWPLTNR